MKFLYLSHVAHQKAIAIFDVKQLLRCGMNESDMLTIFVMHKRLIFVRLIFPWSTSFSFAIRWFTGCSDLHKLIDEEKNKENFGQRDEQLNKKVMRLTCGSMGLILCDLPPITPRQFCVSHRHGCPSAGLNREKL